MKKQIILSVICLLLFSCEEYVQLEELGQTGDSVVEQDSQQDLTYDISIDDINNVLSKLSQKSRGTDYTISVLKDSMDNPSMYVVNYGMNDGFIILSTTKKATPVLAYSDQGHFEININDHPVSLWLQYAETFVQYSRALPEDSIKESIYEWNHLLHNPVFSNQKRPDPKSRYNYITDDEYQELQALVNAERINWQSKGYNTYTLDSFELGEDILDLFKRRAQEAIYPLYEDYWNQFTFIISMDECDTATTETVKTHWTQNWPYNKYCYIPGTTSQSVVGCGPLAVGQIMYYYEYPNTFDWNGMKGSNGDDLIAQMLNQVGEKCNVDYKTNEATTSTDDLQKALKSYGYNVKQVDDNNTDYPKLVTSSEAKHAWIECGTQTYWSIHFYRCFTLTERRRINPIEDSPISGIGQTYTYINWGWGASYDGYYISVNSLPNGTPFSSSKKFSVKL